MPIQQVDLFRACIPEDDWGAVGGHPKGNACQEAGQPDAAKAGHSFNFAVTHANTHDGGILSILQVIEEFAIARPLHHAAARIQRGPFLCFEIKKHDILRLQGIGGKVVAVGDHAGAKNPSESGTFCFSSVVRLNT